MSKLKHNLSKLKLNDSQDTPHIKFTARGRHSGEENPEGRNKQPEHNEEDNAAENHKLPQIIVGQTKSQEAVARNPQTESTHPQTEPHTASAHQIDPRSSPQGKEANERRAFTPEPTPVRPNNSSASISSQKSKKGMSAASSVLELRRFFGQGRTKHDHGVKASEPGKRATFNIFGRKKKNHNHSSSKDSVSTPTTPSTPSEQGHSDTGSGYFGLTSFRHRRKHHHPPAANGNSEESSPVKVIVKGAPPADLDPNFVVHAPDYEADWDPFHIFGLEHSSERLPFLESGITKYGEMGRDVGSGAGGSVRMMERPSDHKIFAVKEFRARRSNETLQKYAKHVAAEYALGAALHHKNIIETIDLIKEGDKYYEIMEYGPYDFFELVMSGTMSTPQINSSFAQILSGVAYLHSIGVAHRDLKLDNCVVTDDGVVKIIDFGSSVVFKYPMSPQIHLARGIMGSDPYLAPEVFLRHPYQPQYTDVWSCGIIYACTYMRRFPWKLPQRDDLSFRKFSENPTNITGEQPQNENPRKITGPWRLLRLLPRDSRPLIVQMLKIEVKERISMEEVMNDPWYKSIERIGVLPEANKGNDHHHHS